LPGGWGGAVEQSRAECRDLGTGLGVTGALLQLGMPAGTPAHTGKAQKVQSGPVQTQPLAEQLPSWRARVWLPGPKPSDGVASRTWRGAPRTLVISQGGRTAPQASWAGNCQGRPVMAACRPQQAGADGCGHLTSPDSLKVTLQP
jgi:hypothetical protein